jgi:Fe-S-cluster containining protein
MPTRDAQGRGRVHLAIVRDPATGGARVSLEKPVFAESWQDELTAAAANTAYELLGAAPAPTLERIVELARNAMAATSRLAEGLLARAPEGGIACKAGCDHCCYQSVGVTPPEALAIVAHLRATLSRAELAAVAAHIAERHGETGGLTAAERFSPDHPCPFLRSGQCSIYEARPLSCRGMNSLDAGECARRLREPEARATFLADGRGGHSFMEPIRAFHAISAGLQLGLSEIFRLDMRPLELTAAIHLLLEGPETTATDWLRGERSFEPARLADGGNDPGLRELSGALPKR